MDYNDILNGIWLALGIFMGYSAFLMKTKGEVKQGWLVSRNIDISKSKDLPGYVKHMYPRTLFLAIVMFAYGCMGIYEEYVAKLDNISFVAYFAVIAIFIWFAVISVKSSKKYLMP